MKCVSIRPESIQELVSSFQEAKMYGDLVEIRLDGLIAIEIDELLDTLKVLISSAPVLLSMGRKKVAEGIYYRLAALKPEFLDIPEEMPRELFSTIATTVKVIASYHNFDETPEDVEEVIVRLKTYPAHFSKCVTWAKNGLDCLRMLSLVKKHAPLIGFCMGEEGIASRILSPKYGGAVTFLSLAEKPTAIGQLQVGARVATRNSEVFALVGTPVAQSLSGYTHSRIFEKNTIDALYVKLAIDTHYLEQAKDYFDLLDFRGLSVTMPLKSYFGGNTVHYTPDGMRITNTDGIAMVDAIEQQQEVVGKNVIVFGAGATAEAICIELKKRGALLFIANRTQEKAEVLASWVGATVLAWDDALLKRPYDILINATSVGMKDDDSLFFFCSGSCSPKAIVADVISTKQTPFLKWAAISKAFCIAGHQMWLLQAARQFAFWYGLCPKKVHRQLVEVCEGQFLRSL